MSGSYLYKRVQSLNINLAPDFDPLKGDIKSSEYATIYNFQAWIEYSTSVLKKKK